MRKLLLLRHAKAEAHDARHDKSRGLTERGRNDAAAMGRVMRRKRRIPELVLCSTARRTLETWEHLVPELKASPKVSFLDALYDATATAVVECIREADANVRTLLVIGHNPGLEDCARTLARSPEDPREDRAFAALLAKFPTAALVVFGFDIGAWTQVASRTGALLDYMTPKDVATD